jgi:hypothetical protein
MAGTFVSNYLLLLARFHMRTTWILPSATHAIAVMGVLLLGCGCVFTPSMWRAAAANKACNPELVGTVPKPAGETHSPEARMVKYTVPGGVFFSDASYPVPVSPTGDATSNVPQSIDVPPGDRAGRMAAAVVLTPVSVCFDALDVATLGMFWWTDGFGTGVSSQTPGLH